MSDSQEKLEILNMIKEGSITPEQGVRLIEALDRSEKKEPSSETGKDELRWLSIELKSKTSGEYKNLTPIRIPMSLIRLFFRFIPKESSLPGSESSLEEILNMLERGKPIELLTDEGEEGRKLRIIAE